MIDRRLGHMVPLLVFLLACGGSNGDPDTSPTATAGTSEPPTSAEPSTPPSATASAAAAAFQPGPAGFPIPKDAVAEGPAPGGGGKITVYKIQRGRAVVADEIRALLKSEGWTIDSDESSPRGSIRLSATKAGTTIKASVAGDDSAAGLIITAP